MRLTFIDLNASKTNVEVDGTKIQGINSFKYTTADATSGNKGTIIPKWLYAPFTDAYLAANAATMGAPAIEIGQYDPSDFKPTRPDIKPLIQGMANTEIPGYRRFLVTYDGTLYAMNAFIKGTMIGSEIVGSRFLSDNGKFEVSQEGWLGIGEADGQEFY